MTIIHKFFLAFKQLSCNVWETWMTLTCKHSSKWIFFLLVQCIVKKTNKLQKKKNHLHFASLQAFILSPVRHSSSYYWCCLFNLKWHVKWCLTHKLCICPGLQLTTPRSWRGYWLEEMPLSLLKLIAWNASLVRFHFHTERNVQLLTCLCDLPLKLIYHTKIIWI